LFKNDDNFSKNVSIVEGYKDIFDNELVGFNFKNTFQNKKLFKNFKSSLENRGIVYYGTNILKYNIMLDENIEINNNDRRIWFFDIEIDNFSKD
jgi:hypothetical protein